MMAWESSLRGSKQNTSHNSLRWFQYLEHTDCFGVSSCPVNQDLLLPPSHSYSLKTMHSQIYREPSE